MWPTIVLSLFFLCRNCCAENFVMFFYEIKLLFTYLLKKGTSRLSVVGPWVQVCLLETPSIVPWLPSGCAAVDELSSKDHVDCVKRPYI